MRINRCLSLRQKLDNDFTDIVDTLKQANDQTGKIEKACTNYLCIRLTGLLEQYHKAFLLEQCHGSCPERVVHIIEKFYPRSKEMNPDNCLQFWDVVNVEFAQILRSKPEFGAEGKWFQAINGAYSVRHSQAHGGDRSVGINGVKDYKKHIFEYLDFIETARPGAST